MNHPYWLSCSWKVLTKPPPKVIFFPFPGIVSKICANVGKKKVPKTALRRAENSNNPKVSATSWSDWQLNPTQIEAMHCSMEAVSRGTRSVGPSPPPPWQVGGQNPGKNTTLRRDTHGRNERNSATLYFFPTVVTNPGRRPNGRTRRAPRAAAA